MTIFQLVVLELVRTASPRSLRSLTIPSIALTTSPISSPLGPDTPPANSFPENKQRLLKTLRAVNLACIIQ